MMYRYYPQSRLVTTHTENHKMIQEPTKGFIISRE